MYIFKALASTYIEGYYVRGIEQYLSNLLTTDGFLQHTSRTLTQLTCSIAAPMVTDVAVGTITLVTVVAFARKCCKKKMQIVMYM